MKKITKQKVVICGCGNIAWHLAKHFISLKKYTVEVYNHRANALLDDFKLKLKCKVSVGFESVVPDADFYFICVSDKHISSVAKNLTINNPNALLLHTSGSVSIKDLGKTIYGTGVFYPLQTFSRQDEIEWKSTPIIIEANNKNSEKKLNNLAKVFSDNVCSLSSSERLRIHLAAVFVNNFTNALYVAAKQMLKTASRKDNYKLLLPLINKTNNKLLKLDPVDAQTGPAKRKDKLVMKKHLQMLQKENELRRVYKLMSKLIHKQQHDRNA